MYYFLNLNPWIHVCLTNYFNYLTILLFPCCDAHISILEQLKLNFYSVITNKYNSTPLEASVMGCAKMLTFHSPPPTRYSLALDVMQDTLCI